MAHFRQIPRQQLITTCQEQAVQIEHLERANFEKDQEIGQQAARYQNVVRSNARKDQAIAEKDREIGYLKQNDKYLRNILGKKNQTCDNVKGLLVRANRVFAANRIGYAFNCDHFNEPGVGAARDVTLEKTNGWHVADGPVALQAEVDAKDFEIQDITEAYERAILDLEFEVACKTELPATPEDGYVDDAESIRKRILAAGANFDNLIAGLIAERGNFMGKIEQEIASLKLANA